MKEWERNLVKYKLSKPNLEFNNSDAFLRWVFGKGWQITKHCIERNKQGEWYIVHIQLPSLINEIKVWKSGKKNSIDFVLKNKDSGGHGTVIQFELHESYPGISMLNSIKQSKDLEII